MSIICPTVLASDPHTYREQVEKASTVGKRIQIDLMDGVFAPSKSINPIQAWWPDGVLADIHLMFQNPIEHLETLISLKPHLIIFHAESEGDVSGAIDHCKKFGIQTGIALLAGTLPESHENVITNVDHVLIFSGTIGSFGGTADLNLLNKVPVIKKLNQNAEIGWDGGANESNVQLLAQGGVDVINVGSAIQRSDNSQNAYDTLVAKLTT